MKHVLSKPAVRAPPRMRAPRKCPAPTRRPLAEDRRGPATFWIFVRQRAWMTEEAAWADRPHSLLQDNPASG